MYPCGSKKIKGKGKETEQWGAFAFLTFVTAYVNNHFAKISYFVYREITLILHASVPVISFSFS